MIHPRADDLLALAIADPTQAWSRAARLVADETDPRALSLARQAMGIVLRHRGQLDESLRDLRAAVRLAHVSGDVDREADARATLGVTLAMAGRTRAGLDQLELSLVTAVDPVILAKILMRRGHVRHFFLAHEVRALEDLEQALRLLRSVGEHVWEARTLNVIGACHLALGRVAEAELAIRTAEEIFLVEGQVLEAVITLHNRGSIALGRGTCRRPCGCSTRQHPATRPPATTRPSW